MTPLEKWPTGQTPQTAIVYTQNQVTTEVRPDALWAVLIDATAWPTWYPHSANVRTTDAQSLLHLGSVFTWKTAGANVTSEVVEFEPGRSLGWTARSSLSHGFHRFDFAQADEGQTLITTEEVESGIGPRLIAGRLKRDLTKAHQVWLEQLVIKASA